MACISSFESDDSSMGWICPESWPCFGFILRD